MSLSRKEIESEKGPNNTNTNNFESFIVWPSPQTKRKQKTYSNLQTHK